VEERGSMSVFSQPIASDLLPVVAAWTRLDPSHRRPAHVELLGVKPKSTVHRLVAAGPHGGDVIAKSCARETAILEREVYSNVLPAVMGEPSGWLAFADDGQSESAWLFFVDCYGEAFDPGVREHREHATRWLARLHTQSVDVPAAAELPDRGPRHYLEHLHDARRTLHAYAGKPILSASDQGVLARTLARLERIAAAWNAVEEACATLPRALVHGDFAARNLRLTRGVSGPTLVVFDWECAGFGLPGVDLADADVELYATLVRKRWPAVGRDAVWRMANLGRLLRGGLAATHWAATHLASVWVEEAVATLALYEERIEQALRELGIAQD
jgi:hypothetical protein